MDIQEEALDPQRKESRARYLGLKREEKVIRFYATDRPYGAFSNFAKLPFELGGKIWPTSEHYFQAMKFYGTPHEEELRLTPTAMQAAKRGRERSRPLRSDWEESKVGVMLEALLAKVEQHPAVRELLLSTGDCLLVEHTGNDAFWGDNGDGTGQNMLGRLLMQVRGEQAGYRAEFFLPPWIVFPGQHPFSIFWRMGDGEGYLMELGKWHDTLNPEAELEYRRYFVPPEEWADYYPQE
ncbi:MULTISPECIES: NADAR family protein [Paenibacillus]|uniref:NADAR family protein n=1 Tax=Paenibacillus TaxID=44249 RepID=UPI0022B937C8|nr:NADAR family protein [Paenibacillus caseinilyticus]MCZ8519765.1 NADAR family protein [Paenibacillus caseinilyticus]